MATFRTEYDAFCEINDNIMKLDKMSMKESNHIIEWLKLDIVNAMKKNDELFEYLFREIYFSGSYYDGLKIREPDEFDLNIVLRTSQFEDFITLEEGSPGKFKIKSQKWFGLIGNTFGIVDKFYKEFVQPLQDSSGREAYYIIPNRVRNWFSKVFEKSKHDIPMRIGDGTKIIKLKTEQNGPAFTLKLQMENGKNVDIDLAVVFPIPLINFKSIPAIWKNIKGYSAQDAFLVPISAEKYGPEWSVHFPMVEKEIILDHGCAKPVIRFLKQFRDANKPLAQLKSYALKTVVMKMIKKYPNYGWEIGSEPHYFLLALEELKKRLEAGRIDWIFHNQSNLLKTDESKSMAKFVSTALVCMNNDRRYETWIKYFTSKNTASKALQYVRKIMKVPTKTICMTNKYVDKNCVSANHMKKYKKCNPSQAKTVHKPQIYYDDNHGDLNNEYEKLALLLLTIFFFIVLAPYEPNFVEILIVSIVLSFMVVLIYQICRYVYKIYKCFYFMYQCVYFPYQCVYFTYRFVYFMYQCLYFFSICLCIISKCVVSICKFTINLILMVSIEIKSRLSCEQSAIFFSNLADALLHPEI